MMDLNKLNVVVFTQEEYFFIPKNIMKLSKVCNIIEVVDNQSKNSMDNKMTDLIKWFGFTQCFKMGLKTIHRRVQGLFDRCFRYSVYGGECSIKDISKKIGATYKIVKNINSPEYVEHIREINPDVILSFSAPQVVKEPLLSIPKYGILNVHGAILPHYRGLLPSFWYLYNDEKLGGATVHFMSDNIDDGDIFLQDTVDISKCKSMFELMRLTKTLGGELMVKAVQKIENGDMTSTPNILEEGSYFTWPTVQQTKEFRKKGKSLI